MRIASRNSFAAHLTLLAVHCNLCACEISDTSPAQEGSPPLIDASAPPTPILPGTADEMCFNFASYYASGSLSCGLGGLLEGLFGL